MNFIATVSNATNVINNSPMQLSTSDLLQLIGILCTSLLSIVSIIISVVTLRQNHKMIEESSRPIISIYTQRIYYYDSSHFYLVVKNFGQSTAYMTKFVTDKDFKKFYAIKNSRNYIDDLNNCVIAPGQCRICHLDYNSIQEPVHFSIAYHSGANPKKIYSEEITIDLKAATSMLMNGPSDNMEADKRIASALESMLLKDL